jgi:hypothetical protein
MVTFRAGEFLPPFAFRPHPVGRGAAVRTSLNLRTPQTAHRLPATMRGFFCDFEDLVGSDGGRYPNAPARRGVRLRRGEQAGAGAARLRWFRRFRLNQ